MLTIFTPHFVDIDKIGRSRDWVLNALTAENIGVGVHYLPVHLHPFYRKTYSWKQGDFPNTEWIGERTLSLPFSAALNDKDVEDVIEAFRKVLKHQLFKRLKLSEHFNTVLVANKPLN